MKVALFSNYLNHHQLPLCKALCACTGGQFTFVATQQVSEERKALGYSDINKAYPFVLAAYDGPEAQAQAMKLAEECDVMIIGSAPEAYVTHRMEKDKLTFRYSERLYKKSYIYALSPNGQKFISKHHRAYKNDPVYMLCASAFTAGDFALNGAYIGKTYKWGYFPETKRYEDINELIEQKKKNSLIWVGRFIDWKHPEYVVALADRLKKNGYDFEINMLGTGPMLEQIQALVVQKGLAENVHILGARPADQVRAYMEDAQIHLFTSDRQEGWGAVLNEAMNSACVPVACDEVGSAPFLIQNGENGLLFRSKNQTDLYKQVKYLLDNPQSRKAMAEKAYKTMTEVWNAEEATRRLLMLCEALMQGEESPRLYEDGPCSQANIL